MKSNIKSAQSGFTLVELIVVIIILAILGAVAFPKFMDVTSKAQISAVKGAGGGLGAGVALFHAQWVANGHTSLTNNVAGFGDETVDSNDAGWPTGITDNVEDDTDTINGTCLEVWDNVMQGPPKAAAAFASGVDYVVTGSTGGTCTYTYHGGNSTAPKPDGSNAMTITYVTATGVVQVNNATES